jgi:hypothetical protein
MFFRRHFTIGKDGHTGFGPAAYPAVKRLYDAIASSDAETLALKQKDAPKEP